MRGEKNLFWPEIDRPETADRHGRVKGHLELRTGQEKSISHD